MSAAFIEELLAKSAVQAVEIQRGALKVRVVVGLCAIAIPLANEVAKDADIGVVVCYDLGKRTTTLTFVTHNKTDLSFVERVPWSGCGGECTMQKGVILDITDALKMLSRAY